MTPEPLSAMYRRNAANEQILANESALDHVRGIHQRASAKWVELADRATTIEGSARRR